MAAREILINEPLCFLMNMYGKDNDIELKSIFYDFYNSMDVGITKEVLVGELSKLKPTGWSKPVRRRDASIEKQDSRVRKEIDDIFCMLSVIHDQKLVDKLPCFTCADIRKLPSPKFETGDFRALVQRIERLEIAIRKMKMDSSDNSGLEKLIKEVISGSIKESIDAYAKEMEQS